ncbi:MAG: N-acetyltransferase [Deltaproteobacteria bacterium]|nr:N-acetyltransferase [Deltaproteobacteria bacterium]
MRYAGQAMQTRVLTAIDQVNAAQWDALSDANDPFTEHAFLAALERSACVGPKTGWLPCHVVAEEHGDLIGALPLYLKDNSYGEYIFDWGWAEAAQRVGIPYYPKLVSAVPFTPATGQRLLIANGAGVDANAVTDALVRQVRRLADDQRALSIHWLFLPEGQQRLLVERDYVARVTHQYHFHNADYQSFADLLERFRSPARKAVLRERRRAQQSGLRIERRFGEELTPADWRALYLFYRDTTSRKWGQPYLNRDFFERLRQSFAHRIVSTLAYADDDAPVAGTLNFYKGQHLYGRYWGCVEQREDLHFELCYYQLIELTIERKMTRFEAGAQGPHKIKRGLMPSPIYSAHWLRHPAVAEAVEAFCQSEARALQQELAAFSQHSGPFKRPG